jgi:hypothetical protein
MHKCLRCKSGKIERSRSRSKWEAWRKAITGKRLFRCHACGWRGWGYDEGPKFDPQDVRLANAALASAPKYLKDSPLSRREKRAEIDVTKLDTI